MARIIDDFEDGDTAGWSVTGGTFTADGSNPIDGAYTGKFQTRAGVKDTATAPEIAEQQDDWSIKLRLDTTSNNSADYFSVSPRAEFGTTPFTLVFYHNGDVYYESSAESTQQLTSYNTGETIHITATIQYADNTVDLSIDGSQTGVTDVTNLGIDGGFGGVASTDIIVDSSASGSQWTLSLDTIKAVPKPLDEPESVTQTVTGADSATPSWSAPSTGSSPSGYDVDRRLDGGSWTRVVSDHPETSYDDSFASSADTVQYRVRSTASYGASDWVSTSTKSTNITTLSASTTTGDSIDLNWDAVDDTTDYDVLFAEASGSTESDYSIDQTVSGTSATLSGLEDGERYYARVVARYPGPDSLSPEADATTVLAAPSLDSVDDSVEDELTVNYSLPDDSTDGDVLVELSDDGGSTWGDSTTVADLSATTATITGLPDGVTYTARVTRRTDHAEAVSGTQTATTSLPAATDLTVGAIDAASIELSGWTVEADNGQQRVEYKQSDASQWQTDASTLGLSTTTEVIDGLLTGEAYDIRVVTSTPDTETASAVVSATTTLPDAVAPTLGNGVKDEVAVEFLDVTTNGVYRIQIRETGQASWDSSATGFAEQVISSDGDTSDTVSTIFTGREDGEEYAVRLRSETEHATGAWTSPTSIVTKFPGAANLQLDPDAAVTETSVPLVWIDQSDNEDGFDIERRRRYEAGWGEWTVVATRGPNTESHVDDTALPGNEYEYRVRAYTDDTEAYSAVVAVSTPGLDVESKRIPASGWYVEIEHPDANTPLTPRVVGSPQKNPAVNGLPRLRVPVPKDDKWNDTGFEDAPMRVWEDGIRQPVDELVRREQEPNQTLLVGEGGTALKQSVQRDIVEERADVFVRNLVPAETPYSTNVDEPTGTAQEDVPQQGIDTQSDYEALLADPIPATEPARLNSDGTVETLATLDAAIPWGSWEYRSSVVEIAETTSGSDYINNRALRLTGVSGTIEAWTTVGLEYDLPAERVGIAVRVENETSSTEHVAFEIRVDGTTVSTVSSTYLVGSEGMRWFEVLDAGDTLGELAAGGHEIRVVPTAAGSDSDTDSIAVNGAAVYDTRDYDSLESTVTNGKTSSPTTHAHEYPLEFIDAQPAQSVVGGRVDVSVSATSGLELALSNDSGATWRTAGNTDSFETEWTAASSSLRARVTLSSSGGSYQSGLLRKNGHVLDAVDVFADLQDIPILANEAFDNSLKSILNTVADDTNSVWEVRRGPDGYSVEWTQPGQRPTEIDTEVLDYSHSEDTSERVQQARVFGASRKYSETIAVQHDTEVALTHSPLVDASERVEDPDTGTVYEYGADYVPRGNAGTIEALSTGDITDGQDVRVTYEYSLKSSYTAADAGSNPQSQRFDFNIPTERGCGQAARYIVQRLKDPVVEAELIVPKAPLDWKVINAINPDIIPGDPKQIRGIEQTPKQVVLQLENREPDQNILEDIRTQMTSNTRQV